MKCLRSGYCCIYPSVVIAVNPDLGMVEGNMRLKAAGEVCPHLQGTEPGNFRCAVHELPWFRDTACHAFSQQETSDSPCRVGEHILKNHVRT